MDFIPLTEKEKKEMLEKIGVGSMDGLFAAFSPRLARELNVETAGTGSELEVSTHMKQLAGKNKVLKYFLGAGAYDHYIPAAVDSIISRSEFYTAYTPYQAEVSQGTLQAIYEFQTYICLLTGMDAANASMYDGASALAESA
ncbi:glycine dehydrogenase, partial [Candidatus Micrarchaeota archaeon CG06_land_8_20_14_3_00_50_6]